MGLDISATSHLRFERARRWDSDEAFKIIDEVTTKLAAEKKKLWDQAFEDEITTEFKERLQASVDRARKRGKPPAESMFDDVYMNPTAQLLEQRDELLGLEGPESSDIGEFPL